MKKFRKVVKNKDAEKFIKELKEQNLDFSLRKGSDCYEIYLDDTHFLYATTKNFPQRKLHLFRTVNLQAEKYLSQNKLVMPKENRQSHWNYEFDETKTLAGTDLNHAYWRIAYIKGIITQKTYISGLYDNCKQLRLATLSILGRKKTFDIYEKGKVVDSKIVQKENPEMRKLFKMIRNTCYTYMYELSELLGDDFFCWKTDCIYYVNTKQNIQMVQEYFKKNNLTFKQLAY